MLVIVWRFVSRMEQEQEPSDDREAIRLFRAVALQGHSASQYWLGIGTEME